MAGQPSFNFQTLYRAPFFDPPGSNTMSREWVRYFESISISGSGALLAVNNLSDLTDVLESRLNLGLGSAATHAAGDFDAAGSAAAAQAAAEAASDPLGSASIVQGLSLQKSANLSDVANAATSLANLIGAWQSWTPTATPSAGSLSGLSYDDAKYLRIGPLVMYTFVARFTNSLACNVTFSLPVNATVSGSPSVTNFNTASPAFGFQSSTTVAVQNASGTIAPGAQVFIVSGFYPA